MFRLLPHKLLGEGHFVAVLRKMEGNGERVPLQTGEKAPKQWTEFAKELGIQLPEGRRLFFGQSLHWIPEDMPDIHGVKVLRPGLELGQVKKDRFEPSHALALWLKSAANCQDYPADSDCAQRWLHGDVVESSKKGWCLVTVDGYSIGWGKGDGKVLKNHYPKGLRR